jgi:hypothetical protein
MTSADRYAGHALVGTMVLAALLSVATPSAAVLECPVPQPLSRPGILKETPAQIAQVETLLSAGDADNHIRGAVNDLRQRYPGVENAEIMNYLMTAYCRVVAQLSGLDSQEQRARMARFASQLSQIIY